MSTGWKAVTASIGLIVVGAMTWAMMAGFAADYDSRWAVASLVVFVVAGITGLITGTQPLMKRAWSRVTLYILFAALLVITATNAFLNSEAWFVALGINVALIWLEFVGLDLFASEGSSHGTHITPQQGAM